MMKRWYLPLVLGMVMVLALAACSQGGNGAGTKSTSGIAAGISQSSDSIVTGDQDEEIQTVIAQIDSDYTDALSPMGQLALGTLRLDDGELAVDEAQATDLLPLWQALQSLSNSQTTAQVELDAVVKQIQGAMSAEQVAAIAEMQLTEKALTETIEGGELGFRGFGGGNAAGEGEGGSPLPPGGFAGGGPGGGPGGGTGGGFGGPGGGPGAGPGGGFGGNMSEDDIATRRAEFAESGLGDLGERFLTGAVVRLMQSKTGQEPADRGGLFTTVFEVVAEETTLSIEQIQASLAEGQTLSEVIVNNDGDIEVVREALIDALGALPDAENFDAEELADQWLSQ